MKKFILILPILLVCSIAHAEKVRVYTDYSPVRILKLVDGQSMDVEAQKASLSGNFKEIDSSQIPNDRSDRQFWKFKGGQVVVDSEAKKSNEDKRKSESDQKTVLKNKLKALGLDDEEIKLLGVKL